jgi:hypothetical protein
MNRLQLTDDEIGRKLQQAERSGELRSAKGYGEPLPEDTAWQQTPDALRMPFKILKDAGVVPYEVELMRQRAALRAQVDATTDPERLKALHAELSLLEQNIAFRLEALRKQG